MSVTANIADAEAVVRKWRQSLETAGADSRRALAQALLELSRAFDTAARETEALAAARESVEVLAPCFFAAPQAEAEAMRSAVTHYVAMAQRLGTSPDSALLTPIAQGLGDVDRLQDRAEDGEP